jgi:hypothetical protein
LALWVNAIVATSTAWLLVPFVVVLQIFFLLLCAAALGDLNGLRKPLFVLNLVLGAIGSDVVRRHGRLVLRLQRRAARALSASARRSPWHFSTRFLVSLARDRASTCERPSTKADAEGAGAATASARDVLVDRTIRMSVVRRHQQPSVGAVILSIIVTLITLGFQSAVQELVLRVPAIALDVRGAPAGPRTSYTAINATQCPSYLAWPGINPPCASLSADDGLCKSPGSFDALRVQCPNGARWSNDHRRRRYGRRRRSRRRSAPTSARCPVGGADVERLALACVRGRQQQRIGAAVRAVRRQRQQLAARTFAARARDCPRGYDPAFCDSRHLIYRIPLLVTGLWWLLLSIPAMKFFQRRHGDRRRESRAAQAPICAACGCRCGTPTS